MTDVQSVVTPAVTATVTHSTTQLGAAPPSTGPLLSQVGSMLVGVLLLIVAIAWVVRKLGLTPQIKHNKLIKVISNCQVGQRERIVVIEIDNTWLVLGVTPQQITPLHTLPAKEITCANATEESTAADFRQLFNKVIKRPDKSE